MDQLTTFADYRVPQVLRHWGALQYTTELAAKVDSQIELSGEEEVSIRAGTVVCVDELVQRVNSGVALSDQVQMTAVTLDWHLWQVGERMNQQGELQPHHRVNTIFY
jgi:Potential Queuosine, Q, salvage protein family